MKYPNKVISGGQTGVDRAGLDAGIEIGCSEKYSSADFVSHAGIPVYIDAKHKIALNKIMIIDRNTLITGSKFACYADQSIR
jgi:hypothetical protein